MPNDQISDPGSAPAPQGPTSDTTSAHADKGKPEIGKAEAGTGSSAQPGSNAIGATTEPKRTPQGGQPGKPENGRGAVRGFATEIPPKTPSPERQSQYVVIINNTTGLVMKIDKLNEEANERKQLTGQDYVRVARQLTTATQPLSAAMNTLTSQPKVPSMLNAPAFTKLAAHATAVQSARPAQPAASPQALAQFARSLGSPSAMSAPAVSPAAPMVAGYAAAPGTVDTAAMMRAYFQGAMDYLNAVAKVE